MTTFRLSDGDKQNSMENLTFIMLIDYKNISKTIRYILYALGLLALCEIMTHFLLNFSKVNSL
jgi:hypothetical protein